MKDPIQQIMDELREHYANAGCDVRDEERLRMDAVHVDMVRNQGISVETLAGMLTDFVFANRKLKQHEADRRQYPVI